MTLRLPKIVHEFGRIFKDNEFESYLVGGAVRGIIRREKLGDFDIATDAEPADIKKIFSRVIPTGIKHGTVTVLFKGQTFEVTTFRTDGRYSDGRRPDAVTFVPSLYEDLKRRDFTINAIAAHAVRGTVTDPHDGVGDLKKGIIKAIGDPNVRFAEDGLRLLRACRLASQLHFTIEIATLKNMAANIERILTVSAERLRDELDKILLSEKPSIGIGLMETTGMIEQVLPELAQCRGVKQHGDHDFDVFNHSLYSCDAAPRDNLEVRLAALFHDLGKPTAREVTDEGIVTFHRHEEISEKFTKNILRRLKYSKKTEQKICNLVRHHMFFYSPEWTDAAVRRFLRRVTTDAVDNLILLRIADGFGMKNKPICIGRLLELTERLTAVIEADNALSVKDLAIDGNELASCAGIPRGPEMGVVLNQLIETVLDDPDMNNKDALLKIAREFHQRYLTKNGG